MATLRCASQVVVLHINAKNLERLIVKKNPRSQDMLRDQAFSRYTDIVSYCCNHSLHHLIVVFPLNTGITQLLEEMVFNERWILSLVSPFPFFAHAVFKVYYYVQLWKILCSIRFLLIKVWCF